MKNWIKNITKRFGAQDDKPTDSTHKEKSWLVDQLIEIKRLKEMVGDHPLMSVSFAEREREFQEKIAALPLDPTEQMDILFIGDMQRLQVNPGDVFVITLPHEIPSARLQVIRECIERDFQKILPGHKVLLMSSGIKLGAIGTESKSTTEAECRVWKSWKNHRPEHPQTEVQKLMNEIEYENQVAKWKLELSKEESTDDRPMN